MPCSKNHISFSRLCAKLALILPLLISLASLFTCTKDEPRLMKVLNDKVDTVSVTIARIYSTVVDIGEGVDMYGHCWSKWENPTLDSCENSTSLGVLSEPGQFVDIIAGLDPDSHYYIKAYMGKGTRIVYSNTLDFNTLAPSTPLLVTGEQKIVTINSISIYGTVKSLNTATGITDHGHCWSISNPMPTMNDSLNPLGPMSDTGTFVSTLSNLSPNTIYYIRAYAVNEVGPGYGDTKNIKTLANTTIPTLSTDQVLDKTNNSATCGGYDINNGGEPITVKGVCWAKSFNPTVELPTKTTDGSGTDDFVSYIAGLSDGTLYHVRAYATNIIGTGYGDDISFETLAAATKPTVVTTAVSNKTTTSATSGGTVSKDGGETVTSRGICWSDKNLPDLNDDIKTEGGGTGTFVITMTDLEPLKTYYVRAYATNIIGTSYGQEEHFTTLGTSIPTLSTVIVTDKTANSATCGGYDINNGGEPITVKGVCWAKSFNPTVELPTKTTDGSGTDDFVSYITGLSSGTIYYVRAYAINSKGTGYGQEISFKTKTTPTVVTTAVSDVNTTSANGGGTVTDDGDETVTSRGICWSKMTNPTIDDNYTNEGGGTGKFVSTMTELEQLTTYYVRAYATNVNGTSYGSQVYFTTDFECGTQLPDKRDGKSYSTISIGTQCWMMQNLNLGNRIDGATPQTNNGTFEKYCYDNLESNCNTYGGLYRWDEMMQYTTVESTQGVCPDGFHLPSDQEWKTLEISLGISPAEADSLKWRGTDEGGKLKIADPNNIYWISPNTGATNESRFSALPAGGFYSNGTCNGLGLYAHYWTSTLIFDTQSWYRYLSNESSQIWRIDGNRANSTAVRCVRD